MALSAPILQASNFGQGVFASPIVSDAFTPPPNSILFAIFAAKAFYSAVDPTPFMTITDSAGLVWTLVGGSGDTISFSTGVVVYRAEVIAPVSMTVTGTVGGGLLGYATRLAILSYTSYDPVAPVPQTFAISRGTGFPSDDGSPAWSFNISATPLPVQEAVSVIVTDGSAPSTAVEGAGWTPLDVGIFDTLVLAIEVRRGSASAVIDWAAGCTVSPAYKNNAFVFTVAPLGGGGAANGFMPTFVPGL